VYAEGSNVDFGRLWIKERLERTDIMDSKSYQALEKNTLLSGQIEPHEPTRARNRRIFSQKGVAIATLLFLLWWSYFIAPAFFEILKSETAIHGEHATTDEGFGFDDFDTVNSSIP